MHSTPTIPQVTLRSFFWQTQRREPREGDAFTFTPTGGEPQRYEYRDGEWVLSAAR